MKYLKMNCVKSKLKTCYLKKIPEQRYKTLRKTVEL